MFKLLKAKLSKCEDKVFKEKSIYFNMKETITTEQFRCDECRGISKPQLAGDGFPYEDGWTYLYHFAFKLASNRVPMPRDKHFCSKECLKKFVNKCLDRSMTCLFG